MPDRRPAVLVVDGDDGARAVMAAMVARLGYAPRTASGGAEAVAAYRSAPADMAAVVLAVQMPGLDGPGTLGALREVVPGLPCVFADGGTGPYTAAELLATGAAAVLEKPFALTALGAALEAAVTTVGSAGR